MKKSFVSMEEVICPVCGVKHDTGNLLPDTRLRERFEQKTATGYKLCKEHQQKKEEGYLMLIECDESKSTFNANGNLSIEGMHRTGTVAYMQRKIAKHFFNFDTSKFDFMPIAPEVTESITRILKAVAADSLPGETSEDRP